MEKKVLNDAYAMCTIRHVISKFGDKWSLLVLYNLSQSAEGVMRYGEIHREMADCSQKMLSQTLKNLEQQQLVNRKIYPVVPPKVEYALTERGKSLVPILDNLIQWAQQNFFPEVKFD